MADYTQEEILRRVKKGETLERADLRNLELIQLKLEGANLRRADLEGAVLEGSNLKRTKLTNANLRDAYLAHADLEDAVLQKADLEGANLEGANLKYADLSRANLEGANLEGATLDGAKLTSAQLELANLGGASLLGAELAKADLRETYLGGTKLKGAILRYAQLEKANLEEADLTECDFTEANLRHGYAERANFRGAILERTILDDATLSHADLTEVDLRGASIRHAKIAGCTLTGAKMAGLDASAEQFGDVTAKWVDFSTKTKQKRVDGENLVAFYKQLRSGIPSSTSSLDSDEPASGSTRYFGKGDVLRNASFEFGSESVVEIQSRFEGCTITLVDGAQLTIGVDGVLDGCRIDGPGQIVVLGEFSQDSDDPAIVGPRTLIVGESGSVGCSLEQHEDLTQFGFERGCAMQLDIVRAR